MPVVTPAISQTTSNSMLTIIDDGHGLLTLIPGPGVTITDDGNGLLTITLS